MTTSDAACRLRDAMTRSRRRAVLAGVVAGVLLTGCSAAEDAADAARTAAGDAASSAASAAASSVASQASEAVASAVQDTICGIAGDGQVSDADVEQLRGVVEGAEQAGVPAEFTDPVEDILVRGQEATDSLAALQERCAAR
jgi:hypothetical protein